MQPETDATPATTLTDRRRPGRLAYVSPALLPLLRAEERARLPAPPPEAEDVTAWPDDRRLDAGEGVVLAMTAGALIWTAIIGGAWAALN